MGFDEVLKNKSRILYLRVIFEQNNYDGLSTQTTWNGIIKSQNYYAYNFFKDFRKPSLRNVSETEFIDLVK